MLTFSCSSNHCSLLLDQFVKIVPFRQVHAIMCCILGFSASILGLDLFNLLPAMSCFGSTDSVRVILLNSIRFSCSVYEWHFGVRTANWLG